MSIAFVREESAEAAQEVSLPLRAISAHPNLVTQSGLRGLEHALAESQQALKSALSHLAFLLLITYLTAGLGFNRFNGLESR
jgi:hypothetical protein